MITCGAICPEAPLTSCRLEPGDHQEHFGGYGDDARSWPNPNYVPPPTEPAEGLSGTAKTKAHLTAMARRLRQAQ
jgi:hypothetical protein